MFASSRPSLSSYLWAGPNTLLGLILGCGVFLGFGGWRIVEGVVEIWGGTASWCLRRTWLGAEGMTLGHVILGRHPHTLERLRRHEMVHVRQAERWGPFFLPAYFAGSLWAFLRGGNPYLDNPFEREAFGRSNPDLED